MRELKIKAVFQGLDGSCGYKKDSEYRLVLRHKFGHNIIIEDMDGGGYVEYSSMISFLENWDCVFNLSKN